MKKKNAGFSLVELIIVIAIMAILVGVMAPQLIKYIEKTNISADTQFCDAIHSAIITTMSDPDIITSTDQYDIRLREAFTTTNPDDRDFRLDSFAGSGFQNSMFVGNVEDIIGVNVFQNCTQIMPYLKSKPAKTEGILCAYVNDAGTDFIIYIAHSDATGQGRDINPRTGGDIAEVIHAPEK